MNTLDHHATDEATDEATGAAAVHIGDGGAGRAKLAAVLPAVTVVLLGCALVLLALSSRGAGQRWPQAADAVAIAAAVVMQAAPFVVLGAVAGGAITAVSQRVDLTRWVPRSRVGAASAGVAASVGVLGCECASVTIAQRLTAGGMSRAAGLAVMFASPAVNPIVAVATFTALPGQPQIALARIAGGAVVAALAAVLLDRWWPTVAAAITRDRLSGTNHHGHGRGGGEITGQILSDALTGIGALVGAAVMVAGVRAVFAVTGFQVSESVPLLVVMLAAAATAYLLAVCSSSDAFIVASFPGMPAAAQLTFLLVGPVADVKLTALHARAFGARVAARIPVLAIALALPIAAVAAAVIETVTG